MTESAKPLLQPAEFASESPSEQSDIMRKIAEIIKDTHSEELILSLCGFIGTDIHKVSRRLKHILENTFAYNTKIISLSDYIKERAEKAKGMNKDTTPCYDYIRRLIEGGNDLRMEYGNSILSELAVQKMAFDRLRDKEEDKGKGYRTRRRCYIIDSIKNTEELELLRIVYRDIHYAIGVFSSMEIRRANLKGKQLKEAQIDTLIDRDSGEEITHGQKVRETFTQSDFFLRLDSYSMEELDNRLERFLHLVFSTKVVTPTVEETAMYQASSAAGNSACLSRQVGAALRRPPEVVRRSNRTLRKLNRKRPYRWKPFLCWN
ncbi:MAG: hypothetical protein P4L51_10825 [Puia sp.]|nr:hypothetical protein [Puia sp.]